MKFNYKFIVSGKENARILNRAFWSPTVREWKDVIEDYIYLSRKRADTKLALFKLQINIFLDLLYHCKAIDQVKQDYANELDKDRIQSTIKSYEIIAQALREVADGIAWRLFNFNRGIIYVLAKNPSGDSFLRPTDGLLNEIFKFEDVFLDENKIAILNAITNYLRLGDITSLDKEGNFEFIEVKSGKKAARSPRAKRQKRRLGETVEFFNTGISEYDGRKLKIEELDIKLKNYFPLIKNIIATARSRGHQSKVISNYLLVECIDFEKIKVLLPIMAGGTRCSIILFHC